MPVKKLLDRLRRDDRGAAMAAVVGLIAITTVTTLTIVTVTVSALAYTSQTRSSVQSRAAAEAGLDVTEAGLRTAGDCATHSGAYVSAVEPRFSTAVSYRIAGNWIAGCPVSSATSVRVISTGYAAAEGVGGASAGDETTLEAIFAYTPAAGGITATGGAVRGWTLGLNQATICQGGTCNAPTAADVRLAGPGNFTCQSGTVITGSLILELGSIELNGCTIYGSVRAAGYVAVNSGTNTVWGDVVAGGAALYNNSYAAQVGPNSLVKGSIVAGGAVYIDGKVTQNVTSVTTYSTSSPALSTITPSARVGGTAKFSGGFKTWSQPNCSNSGILRPSDTCPMTGVVTGGVAAFVQSQTAPGAPAPTTWVPYTYKASDWTSIGFTEVIWSGSCQIDNNPTNRTLINTIMNSTTPVVVNALGCSRMIFSNSAALQLSLKSDVAFVSKSFNLENLTIDSPVAAGVRAWFIVPGTTAPTACSEAGGKVDLNSTVRVTTKVKALIYTPSCISSQTNNWRGQLYAGSVQFNTQTAFDFVAVGLPGVNLDGGTVTNNSSGGALGTRSSVRDLAG